MLLGVLNNNNSMGKTKSTTTFCNSMTLQELTQMNEVTKTPMGISIGKKIGIPQLLA